MIFIKFTSEKNINSTYLNIPLYEIDKQLKNQPDFSTLKISLALYFDMKLITPDIGIGKLKAYRNNGN